MIISAQPFKDTYELVPWLWFLPLLRLGSASLLRLFSGGSGAMKRASWREV
jgi:hypothetical protein